MNKIIAMGRLTRDPEVCSTQSGKAVARMTIAVDRRISKTSSAQQTADFLPVIAWEQKATFAQKYLRKGSKVLVEGRLQSRTYEKDGVKRYVVEIVAENIEFAESKRDSTAPAPAVAPVPQATPAPAPQTPAPAPQVAPSATSPTSFGEEVYDDIPF